jgi:photosystem I P700 chlorophyll a apoprotein A2
MMGSFTHAGIFLIRDWQDQQDVIFRMLAHKGAPISHLSWICLWLGFHTLALLLASFQTSIIYS